MNEIDALPGAARFSAHGGDPIEPSSTKPWWETLFKTSSAAR
jgi:hypothetical protein